ncbi:tyrosine-type recombinase/integrase [Actinomadura formosensis]|uniref:tyrosine-type recombinase/integrase n=1 Tax=Actinomadura formosensis TaxID=60706 RepID=UPI003D93E14F
MSVYDRWHTRRPRTDPKTGEPVKACRRCGTAAEPYPSAEHGKGDRWQVRWRDEAGKQCKLNRPKKGGKRDESDPDVYAEALDAKIENELNTDDYTDPKLGKKTLVEFAREWRSGIAANASSLDNYDRRLAHIWGEDSRIAGVPMSSLAKRPSSIQQWVKSLERKGLSPTYIGQIVDILSSIFIAAIDNGVATRNPVRAKSIRLPTPPRRTIVPWTAPMVTAAREQLAERGIGGMADLGVGAGLRQGEIFGIAKEDIQFLGRDRKIRVRRQVKWMKEGDGRPSGLVFAPPKGNKEREAPLSDSLSQRLSQQIEASPPVKVTLPWEATDNRRTLTVELLFVRRSGLPYHRQGFGYIWHEARDAAGAEATPENGMHVLRHTYASVQLAALVDVLKLALWLGHEDPGFTLRKYGHFIPDVADRGRRAVDDFMKAAEAAGAPSALNVPSGAEA